MPRRRHFIVLTAALGASAAPASAAVSLAPVRPCLSELDAVSPNASGLTPGGPVKFDLLSVRGGRQHDRHDVGDLARGAVGKPGPVPSWWS